MKNNTRLRMVGVTLLEILLVLAVSASILIMSVRYYGSAVASLHANQTMEQIQVITATVDNYTAGLSYANISTAFVQALLPKHALSTPWGTNVSLGNPKPNSYNVTLPAMPASVCALVHAKLEGNKHYAVSTPCRGVASDFSYQYTSNA
jgi:type II secretory pathway pseudopilin PulG